MELFNLPPTTIVNRVVPKNTFDKYTNTKQKKLFADWVGRITWLHKLSASTTNVEPKDINEIQVFLVELKIKRDIAPLLDMIDRFIPYPIIFIITYKDELYFSASSKHSNPTNENNAVIDWTFKSEWITREENPYQIRLRKNFDWVFHDFCAQLSGNEQAASLSHEELIKQREMVAKLEKEIAKLKSRIASTSQFNKRVELNIKLKELERKLKNISPSD